MSKMIQNEEVTIQEKINLENQNKTFEKRGGRGYTPNLKKGRHFILKQNDIKKKGKFKMIN